ncbi:hypothetical protein ACIP1U_11185 [Cupriavidus sp. NPDC089707]|uniref:hypothetical protein n=1 Tax=Cupriavidus sp. NPDC089707 TaxID=3363963 RepID=UPI0038080B7E
MGSKSLLAPLYPYGERAQEWVAGWLPVVLETAADLVLLFGLLFLVSVPFLFAWAWWADRREVKAARARGENIAARGIRVKNGPEWLR